MVFPSNSLAVGKAKREAAFWSLTSATLRLEQGLPDRWPVEDEFASTETDEWDFPGDPPLIEGPPAHRQPIKQRGLVDKLLGVLGLAQRAVLKSV